MTFPHFRFLMVGLGIYPRRIHGNDKQSLKQSPYPAHADIQYAAAPVVNGAAGVYWIIRWSLSSGQRSALTRWQVMT
jgi:hypothetical protein